MPKIRDLGSKPNIFETATTQTQRGKKIIHVPVKDSQLSPAASCNVSPSKKWALSPGGLDFNDDYRTDQVPKQSGMSGKVSMSIVGTSN